jgi:hypothetical protein
MKTVSITLGIVLIALIALTLVPAAGDYRSYLAIAALLAAAALLATAVAAPATKPAPAAVEPAAVKSVPPPIAANQADAEVVSFLATLQEKGRFVDFLMDDIALYSDAQVGAAARVVHEGCKTVLREHFVILPVREENESSRVTVPAGYQADEYRLVGKISGQAPFTGTLVHRGWKTESVKLPRVLRAGDNRLPTIAPAEVELP